MNINFVTDGMHSMLFMQPCSLNLLKHAQVANAVATATPGATVTTTGAFFLKTTVHGAAAMMFRARSAARYKEYR